MRSSIACLLLASTIRWLRWITSIELIEVEAFLITIFLIGIHLGEHCVYHLGEGSFCRVSINL